MPGARTFLVERYMPGVDAAALLELTRRLAAATSSLQAEGRRIEWLRSLALTKDETCLCTFQADDPKHVAEANTRAAAPYERIVEAVSVENEQR
jgi:hypothetical protein